MVIVRLRSRREVLVGRTGRRETTELVLGVTLTELRGMPSLRKGYATFFEETLHPAGAARQTMLHISSYGWLEDGAAFQYQATEAGGRLTTVRIRIQ